jgi:hypothetical protein
MVLYKLVILGEGGVGTYFENDTLSKPKLGKSALTIQLTQNHFITEYGKTI